MSYIVQIITGADGRPTPHDGRFLVAWNPHTPFGILELTSTAWMVEAHRFDSPAEPLGHWKMVSEAQPTRPDGRPNRPLTGITIGVLHYD